MSKWGMTILATATVAGMVTCAAYADVFHMTVCGEVAGACYIAPPAAPPPDAGNGLTADMIRGYLAAHIPVGDGPISYTVTGANAGYVYGRVLGGNAIDTQFIYKDGQVGCCFLDWPYSLTAVNDSGLFIGRDPEFLPFAGQAGSPEHIALDDASAGALVALGHTPDLTGFRLTAIDDDDRIAGDGPLGWFLLTPVELLAGVPVFGIRGPVGVPEPGSAALLVTLLASLALLSVRWRGGLAR